MTEYLSPLVSQVALSYDPSSRITTEVKADGATLDLSRATPCGLIVTELITNSFKYAFPPPFDCMKMRSEPCTIRVSLEDEGEDYCLSVSDNGIGLPHGFDIRTAQSLGLRLVYFLARHQLKARIELKTESGTEITFRFS
jgi:two-component sensor histidine kinase